MSGSRSKAVAAFVSLLALPAAFAAAQTTTPGAAETVGPPVVLTPPVAPGEDATTAPAPAVGIERAPSGIEVDALAATAADYGGLLDPSSGGLPLDMWRGTDRAFVERLLPALPVVPESPALRSLARRLLLSSAEAPAGAAERNLMAVRAERLMALGDLEGAAELLALIPESQLDATTARLRLEAAWLAGEGDRACADVPALIQRFDRDVYLQKALIFCQAKAGQTDEAALGLDLLREQGDAGDTAFFELVDVLTGARKTANVEALAEPRGLHLAMLEAGGQQLPEGAADPMDPGLLAIRLAEAKDGAEKLSATERAVGLGLVEPAALVRLYREEAATPEEIAGAMDAAPDSPHARAVLYKAAEQATVPTARAALIRKALRSAPRDGSYGIAARVYLPLVEELQPNAGNAAFAGEAGRALYLGGRYELAAAWLEMARAEAERNPDAAASVPVLLLMSRIAGGAEPLVWDGKAIAAWRQAQSSAGDGEADLRAARLFAIFEGLGEPIGAAWQVLGDPAAPNAEPLPYPALWFAAGDAAAGGRVGETVMLALFILGPDGPGGAHPVALGRALSALRQVGLEAEARSIAFEAALASGV
jgi:hypothetical protein